MVDYKDYYKILGVPHNASAKDVKAAYRRLARKHHPDVNQGNAQAEARFKEINEANEVLSDPEKRRRYDQLGANWDAFRQAAPRAGRRRAPVNVGGDGGFSDFFETFFRGGFGQGGAPGSGEFEDLFERFSRGGAEADLEPSEVPVELTLDELLRGAARTLELGANAGHRKVEVKIPPGMREGGRVRVPAAAIGSGLRDVHLVVRVLPDARFERSGEDLRAVAKAPLTTLVLGGEVRVSTLEGELTIKVPAGTPNGRTFRLREHGLPRREGGGRGDLLVSVNAEWPAHLDARARELYEELRELGH
jgi:curved DNA-binding protein